MYSSDVWPSRLCIVIAVAACSCSKPTGTLDFLLWWEWKTETRMLGSEKQKAWIRYEKNACISIAGSGNLHYVEPTDVVCKKRLQGTDYSFNQN